VKKIFYFSLVLTVLFLLSILFLGRGGDWEFCPDTFQHRSSSTFYVPFTDLKILKIKTEPYRVRISQYWMDSGILEKLPEYPKHWEKITGWQTGLKSSSGPAKVFWYRAGCKTDEEVNTWIEWSKKNPNTSMNMWRNVTKLLRNAGENHLNYQLAAELMRAAKESNKIE